MTPASPVRPDPLASGPDKLWGLASIARTLALSVDTTRRLARRTDVPIYRPGGRYFAFRSELLTWLRTRAP